MAVLPLLVAERSGLKLCPHVVAVPQVRGRAASRSARLGLWGSAFALGCNKLGSRGANG